MEDAPAEDGAEKEEAALPAAGNAAAEALLGA